MLNRIVFTEKNQIATLKVVDELRHVDIKPAMHALEKVFLQVIRRRLIWI